MTVLHLVEANLRELRAKQASLTLTHFEVARQLIRIAELQGRIKQAGGIPTLTVMIYAPVKETAEAVAM